MSAAQRSLFDAAARYPHRAGAKEPTTSREAADRIEAKGTARKLRDAALSAFLAGWQGTADELAERLGTSVLSVRPRVSELHKQGWLARTGNRHRNQSGASAHVWQLNPDHQRRTG